MACYVNTDGTVVVRVVFEVADNSHSFYQVLGPGVRDSLYNLSHVESMADSDRQHPTAPGETVIMLEDVKPCAETENGDRPQPTDSGEDHVMQEEHVTPPATTETEGTDDTQTTWLRSCRTWKPCVFAKWLWGIIYDKENGDFTRLELVLGVATIILYLVDIGTDVRLAVRYFQDGEWIYGGLTTAFIAFAYIWLLVLGLYAYGKYDDDQSRLWFICRLFLVIVGLSPVVA
ncbi:hypothetical protein BaRGS_00002989 [Batillaria attramentaria]|uniref:XK-related protein n=1 Tax=Batillaria attramentaria TaxID=370345 RepID=A0ABD0M211_9CAEN